MGTQLLEPPIGWEVETDFPDLPTDDSAPAARPWRLRAMVWMMLAGWLLLAFRLVHLQLLERMDLTEHASRQSSTLEKIPARPGDIYDRHGRLLATTITVRSMWINPSQVQDPWDTAYQLGQALGISPDPLFEKLSKHHDKQFLWVKRRISEEEAQRVHALELPKGDWGFRDEYLRKYPQGKIAGHILGLRDIDGVGQGGVEEALDPVLRGQDGRRMLVRDARGRVIEVQARVAEAPQHGQSLRLTIDSVIQLFAEEELEGVMKQWKPESACALVMDPHTGDILAMASEPSFDPNHPENIPEGAWKNTTIAAIYEPGSTFKPMMVAWALEQNLIGKNEMLYCEQGAYRMGPRILHDHHAYGSLSLAEVLVKSSNVGMAKVGERLTNEGLYEAALAFGFGRKTGIELSGELSGILRPLKDWTSYSTGSIPMGQEISVTPLQLAVAHAALANHGEFISPRLVLGTEAKYPGQQSGYQSQQIKTQLVSKEVADWLVQEPMTQVVERGTGKKARLKEYSVFGKTGTAQKVDPQTGGYSHTRHVASFICGAPSHDPQVIIFLLVDEPSVPGTHYGGTVAAEPAAHLLRRVLIHLGVPADQ